MKTVVHLLTDIFFTARVRLTLWTAVMVLIAAVSGVAAEHPEHDSQLAAKSGVEFQPRLGEYHYEIRWARKQVATGTITVRKEEDQYVLTTDQRTTDFIDRIYRVRYRGETRIDAATLTPSKSIIEEEVKKDKKVQRVQYDEDSGAVTMEETRVAGKQGREKTKTYEMQSDTGLLDVFSALFLARSFDWSIGERHEFVVFLGKEQFAVSLDCIGKQAFEVEGKRVPVWVIQPTATKIKDAEPASGVQKTRIFIAADESKDIVKVEAEPGIGTVELRLVRYSAQ